MKIADENVVKDQAPVKGIGGVSVPVEGILPHRVFKAMKIADENVVKD